MASLFDATNKLKVSLAVVLNGAQSALFNIVFSESVPNVEQAQIINRLFAFSKELVAQSAAVPGSLFDPASHAEVSFEVLSASGDVLESFTSVFSPAISNEEQSLVMSKLAEFAAQLAGENQ